MTTVWSLLFGFLPVWAQALLFVLIALFFVIMLVRLVGAVLDAIPFI